MSAKARVEQAAELAVRQGEGRRLDQGRHGGWLSAARAPAPRRAGATTSRASIRGSAATYGPGSAGRDHTRRGSVRHALVAGPGRPVRGRDVMRTGPVRLRTWVPPWNVSSSAAERYASAARTVVRLIVGVDPWRAVRRLVTILRREAAAGYPQCYRTLRCLLRGRGWRYRRRGRSRVTSV